MTTELFLILRCDAPLFDIHCENLITTSLADPVRARQWANKEGWTTHERVSRRWFRRRTRICDLCPDHIYLRNGDAP